jgi:hypothetical protein
MLRDGRGFSKNTISFSITTSGNAAVVPLLDLSSSLPIVFYSATVGKRMKTH